MVSLGFLTGKLSSDRDTGCWVATITKCGQGHRLGAWLSIVARVVSGVPVGTGSDKHGSTEAGSEAGARSG